MAEPNPFAAMAPLTPTDVRYRREAELAQQNAGIDNYWAQAAGRAGLDFRNRMVEQGRFMTPEDKRAESAKEIMSRAQQSYGAMVQSGEMDPLDAQEQVISRSMSEFMSLGDYEAAQSFIPALNQIRTYKLEQQKLQSESLENRATAYNQTASGDATTLRLPSEISENEAQAEFNMAGVRLRDRTDPNIRAKANGSGDDSTDEIGTKLRDDTRMAVMGTLNLFDRLDELSQHMELAPEGASAISQMANTGGQYLAGASTFLQRGGTVTKVNTDSLTPEQKAIVERNLAVNAARRAEQAMSLGVSVTTYNSLVIDTAYALARANDPGGRLSNNDFDFALQMLGAVQDVKSAKAAFASIARRAYESHQNRMKGIGSKAADKWFGEQNQTVDSQYKVFEERWGDAPIRNKVEAKEKGPSDCTPARKKYGLC